MQLGMTLWGFALGDPAAVELAQRAEEAGPPAVRRPLHPAAGAWNLARAGQAAVDERWSLVGNTGPPAGGGRPSSPPQARSWPTSWVAAKTRAWCSAKRSASPADCPAPPPIIGAPPPGPSTPTTPPGQTAAAANRAPASDVTHTYHTRSLQAALRRDIDAEARPRHGRIRPSRGRWPGGVTVRISTFETLPVNTTGGWVFDSTG